MYTFAQLEELHINDSDFDFKCMRQAILDKKCYVIHVHIDSVIKLLIQLYWTISF